MRKQHLYVNRAVRANHQQTIRVFGANGKRAYSQAIRRSHVVITIAGDGRNASVILKRGRARELRNLLNRILGDA